MVHFWGTQMTNIDVLKRTDDSEMALVSARLIGVAAPAEDRRSPTAAAKVRVVDPECFDEVAAGFADVIQEQTACYVRARWGASRLETVTIEREGKTIGAAVIILIRLPLIERGVAVVKWGPLWRRPGASCDASLIEANIAALTEEYVERRRFYLTVMPHADPGWSEATAAILEKLGFDQGQSLTAPARYLVNVSLEPDELRKSLGQKWRYNLKKAEKNDFDIEVLDAADGLDRFMALYDTMLERKRFKDRSSVHTLPDLLAADVAAFRPMIVMVRHDGRDTAGAVIDTSGERAVYLYGATDDRALPLKAGYVLHWWIAEYLCADARVRWYDLGGDDADQGLHQFKKGFVGKGGVIETTPPIYHRCGSAMSCFTGRAVYGLRALKAVLGNLVYFVRKR
jgi:lipid II:glycine glycyltransferase (peptidoglycan interpeptide bridge formation enzyme)